MRERISRWHQVFRIHKGPASPTSRVEVVEKDISIAPATVPAARYEAFGLNANAADLCASLRDAMPVQLRRCKVTDQEYDVQQTAMACKNTIRISGSGMTIVVPSCDNFQRLAPCALGLGCTAEGHAAPACTMHSDFLETDACIALFVAMKRNQYSHCTLHCLQSIMQCERRLQH